MLAHADANKKKKTMMKPIVSKCRPLDQCNAHTQMKERDSMLKRRITIL